MQFSSWCCRLLHRRFTSDAVQCCPLHIRPSSKDGIEKKKKKKKKYDAGDGVQDSETAPEGCDETAGGGKGGKGGGEEAEEMAKAERKAAKKAAKKASEGGQQGGLLDPLGAREGVGADGGADDAPLAGSGGKDMDDGGWFPVPEIRTAYMCLHADDHTSLDPKHQSLWGPASPKQQTSNPGSQSANPGPSTLDSRCTRASCRAERQAQGQEWQRRRRSR
jgi:hypothetical protein